MSALREPKPEAEAAEDEAEREPKKIACIRYGKVR